MLRPARLAVGLALVTPFFAACATEEPSSPSTTQLRRPPLAFATSDARPDRYVVSFKTAEPASFAKDVGDLGGTVERRLPNLKLAIVSGLGGGAGTLATRGGVEFLAQDLNLQFIPTPDPSRYSTQSLSSVGPRPSGTNQGGAFFFGFQWNMRQVSANTAWGTSGGGQGALVCVLDTGIDPDHIDLQGKVDPNLLVSFISSPLFGGDLDPLDYNFHGTATAGHISTNGLGMASVAPDAKLCSAKVLNVLGSGSFADVITGIQWAAEVGADVINMSLGAYLDRSLPGAEALEKALQRAIDFATRRGSLVVASSGNDGINLDEDAKNFISIPAQLNNVVSVGATAPFNQGNFDGLASYSNYGGRTGVDLMAPGGDFASGNTLDFVLSTCSQYQLVLPFACGATSYLFISGTSESAPHVSGAAAVLLGDAPALKPGSVTKCLTRSADIIGPSQLFGAGRLNVAATAACRV